MKHVKLLLALIMVLLAGLAASEMALAQGKKKSTSKIPVKTERPAAKRTPQCSDWYGAYSSSAQSNPTGPSSGSDRVFRGGSWFSCAGYCRVSYRYSNSPDLRCSSLGLRLAL